MALPMAAWRVTYTPGNWLVLSGPTVLVVMLPAPARMSRFVTQLWGEMLQAKSPDALLALMSDYGLDGMPDFGAFFWDSDGLHALARGAVRVVDVDTAEVVVDGGNALTWREETLGGGRHLRIDMEEVDQEAVLQLPLVVGSVTASALYLTSDKRDLVRFVAPDQQGILPKAPVLGLRPPARRPQPPAAGTHPDTASQDGAAEAAQAGVAPVTALPGAGPAAASGVAVAGGGGLSPAAAAVPSAGVAGDPLPQHGPGVAVSQPEVDPELSSDGVASSAHPEPEPGATVEEGTDAAPGVAAQELPGDGPAPQPQHGVVGQHGDDPTAGVWEEESADAVAHLDAGASRPAPEPWQEPAPPEGTMILPEDQPDPAAGLWDDAPQEAQEPQGPPEHAGATALDPAAGTPSQPASQVSAPQFQPSVPAPQFQPSVPTPQPPPAAPATVAPVPHASAAAEDPDAYGTGHLAFDPGHQPAVPPESVPTATPAPGSQRSAPVVIAQQPAPADDDGGTIFSTGLAATHKPRSQGDEDRSPQVLAVACRRGHANAPGTRACRLCQAPVDSAAPRLIAKPALAGVHSNHGDFIDLADGVIVGRAPDPGKGPSGAELMRVHSPSSDISRSHLMVTARNWNVIVTDLNSTNGTTVIPTGEQPFVLANGQSVQVEIGTILDLGDGVSLRIEPPRG